MSDLPADMSFGQVIGQFLVALVDGSDANSFPDSSPASGTVTFTASITKLKGAGVVILPSAVTVPLDNTGSLDVYLVATDDPDYDPVDWTWYVSFNLVGLEVQGFNFVLPGGTTVDLSSVVPSDATTGLAGYVSQDSAGTVQKITKLTQVEYDALPAPDPFTAYIIVNP